MIIQAPRSQLEFRTSMRIVIVIAGVVFALFACQKDEHGSGHLQGQDISMFSNLIDGNYWVYERMHLDSSGNYTVPSPGLDSVWVDGDTVIGGVPWKKVRSSPGGDFPSICFQRDSANELLRRGHGVLMASSLTDMFLWTEHFTGIIDVNYTLHVQPHQVDVPAGTFTCQEVTGMISSAGSPVPPEHRWPRSQWSSGVGLVEQRYFWYVGGNGYESRLVRYHVE